MTTFACFQQNILIIDYFGDCCARLRLARNDKLVLLAASPCRRRLNRALPGNPATAFGGNDKKLAKVDGGCYLIQFVLWLQVYCKGLITGNS
jgi:hypothetical protein